MSERLSMSEYFKQRDEQRASGTYVDPSPVQPTISGSADLKTVTDFETNEQMIKDYETTMDAMARNKTYTSGILDTASYSDDGPSEFMRDITFRIGTKINLATDAKDWTNSEKQAFTRLQKGWDKVSVTGMKEWKDTVVDYGIDAVANYETLPAIASLIFGGGAVPAAAQVAGRTALNRTLSKLLVAGAGPTTKTGMAAYGATFAGSDNASLQSLQIATNQKDKFSKSEMLGTAAIGAAAGATLKKGIEVFQGRNTSKLSKLADEQDLDTKIVVEVPETKGLEIFEESLADESIPSSANKVILDLGEIIGDNPNISSETIEKLLKFPRSPLYNSIRQLSKDAGGGEETIEVVENIVLQSVERGATGKEIRRLASHGIWKGTTAVVGKTYGKAAGLLTPYTSYSKSADSLQKIFNYQFGIKFTKTENVVGMDLSETAGRITGDLNTKFLNSIEPVALHEITGELEDTVNAALNVAARSSVPSGNVKIDTAAKEIKETMNKTGKLLYQYGIIKHNVKNYFPRMWSRQAIEADPDQMAKLLVDAKEAKNLKEGQAIVKEMLDKENQLSSGTTGHFFSSTRAFDKIKDDSKFVEFLNPDLRRTVMDYNFQVGKSLSKKLNFGVTNEEGFIKTWVNKIDSEMREAGKSLSRKDKQNIVDLYRTATGENLTRYSPDIQNIADGYQLATRTALLGGVTLSSLTEIMINIGKAGFRNSVKGFAEASEISFKKVTKDIHSELKTKHGLTAKEAYREYQTVGLSMEQASAQLGQHRIAGGELANETMQKISNKFFRLTFLDQWTKYVQRVSFASGKNFIMENLELVAKHGNLKPTNKVNIALEELNELSLDPLKGAEWIKNGSKKTDEFYQNIINGAGRYTNQVILNPSGFTGQRPMLHSKPTTTILFQLLGYPAAFSNTVLKGAAQKIVKNPIRNGSKLAMAGLLMTETARMTNWIRSRGENEKDATTSEIYLKAIARWGGFGLAPDQLMKGEKALAYNRSAAATALQAVTGPVVSDVTTLLSRGPVQALKNKVPLSSLANAIIGKENNKELSKWARKADTAIKEALDIEEDYRATFKKGGEVEIPNAPAEPDERVNKLTGLPYNYEAGASYMDEDDPLRTERKGFALGAIVKGTTKLVSKAFSPKGDSGFFSMAEKKAMEIQRGKGTGAEFINELKSKGVTEDELNWTGFNDEFSGKPKVTKEEVVGYLNVNRLDVESRTGRPSRFDEEDMYAGMDDDVPVDDFFEGVADDIDLDSEFTPVSQHIEFAWEGRDTQNYREITLSLPKSKQRGEEVYKTTHFAGQENVVAHLRLADIVTADGKEILLLDELQSDVHKAGSKFGYLKRGESLGIKQRKKQHDRLGAEEAKLLKEHASLEEKIELGINTPSEKTRQIQIEMELETIELRYDTLLEEAEMFGYPDSPVPDMPFQQRKGSGWAQLGIKRALMEAAEKDYDTLAMTTGQQQIERNTREVPDIQLPDFKKLYDRDYIKILNKFGKKYGQKVEMIEVLQGDEIVEVPSIKITEEWRNDIQRGLAQFNKGGKVLNKLKGNCN